MLYKNYEGDIAIKFDYENEEELRNNLEGIVYTLLQVINEYNLVEETVEELNDGNSYYLGDNFKAINVHDFDEWLGEDWVDNEHWGNNC